MRAKPLARPVTARVGVDAMTAVDWIIVAFVALMALWGYAQGLIVSALSLAGFAGGAFVGSRLAPLLLDQGSSSPYAPLFSLVSALMVGGLAAIVFEALGEGIRRRMSFRAADVLDGIGGAVLVATLGLGLVWIAGAVALQTPGARELRQDIQRSAILSKLNEALPPSGPLLNALARADPFPRIRGPGGRRSRPDAAHPARRRRAGGAARASCGFSATPAASPCRDPVGWRGPESWSRTHTSWPVRTTPRSRPTAATGWTRQPWSSTRTTTSPC